MAKNYVEDDGSPNITLSVNGHKMTRRLICDWDDKIDVAAGLLNASYTITTTPRRVVYCTDCQIAPMKGVNTGSGKASAYEKAIITAQYQSRKITWETSSGVKLAESFTPATEYLPVSAKDEEGKLLFRWGSADGPKIPESAVPGRITSVMEYSIVYYDQKKVPDDIFRHYDKVNSVSMKPQTEGLTDLTFSPETLLFFPPALSHTVSAGNASRWDITFRFKYRPNYYNGVYYGWNYFWNPATQSYQSIYKADGGQVRPFQKSDFSNIIAV